MGFNDDGSVIVGQKAADRAIRHPERTATAVRRHLGTDWRFTNHGTTYTAPQITACVLRKLKRDAQAALGAEVTDVVLSMPAHYGEAERRATLEAAELAGLRVRRLVGETNLAGFAYAMQTRPADETTLVLDLGAGTFSVSLLYGIPLAILGVIVTASFITDGAGSALAVAVLFLGVAGLVWLRKFISSPRHTAARVKYVGSQNTGSRFRDAQLSLYEPGTVVQSGDETHVFRWDTVSVLQDLTRVSHKMYGTETGVSWIHRYQLTDPSGTSYLVTGDFTGPEQWGPEIQRRVAAAQLPRAVADIEAGKTLEFASIALSRSHIRAHGRSVSWSEVQEIRVDKGYISIRVAGEWFSLAKTTTNAIPNVFIFLELAESLRTAAA